MSRLVIYGIIALGVLAAITATIFGIYHKGYDAGSKEVKLEWEKANTAQRELEAKQAAGAATTLETTREKERIVTRTITQQVDRLVDRPVYRNVCLDPDGLRLAQCAILGQSPDTCKPDNPVPAPSKPGGGNRIGGLKMDYGFSGSVSRLLGKAQGSDGGG